MVVRALIEASGDVNKAAENGVSRLCIAAQNGHEAVEWELIEASADINKAAVVGATPLYFAAQEGLEAVLRALIETGADVNKADDDRRDAAVRGVPERTIRRRRPPALTPYRSGAYHGRSKRPRGGGSGADRGECGRQQGDGCRRDAAVRRRL